MEVRNTSRKKHYEEAYMIPGVMEVIRPSKKIKSSESRLSKLIGNIRITRKYSDTYRPK